MGGEQRVLGQRVDGGDERERAGDHSRNEDDGVENLSVVGAPTSAELDKRAPVHRECQSGTGEHDGIDAPGAGDHGGIMTDALGARQSFLGCRSSQRALECCCGR